MQYNFFKIHFTIYILFILLNINKIYADDTITKQNQNNKDTNTEKMEYCEKNELGWKWSCDIKENKEDKENKNKKQKSYTEQLKQLQTKFEEIKAKAVLEPTEQNLKEYMFMQQLFSNKASLFADGWQRILWKTPELDYTQKIPVNTIAKTIWKDNRKLLEENTLKNINQRYGLFFIYSTTCSYCQKYSQILLEVKNEYKIEIKGISIDGKFLPHWENNSVVDKGQLSILGVKTDYVPITILYDNNSKTILPVGYGLLSKDELLTKIYYITETKAGEVY